jgi:hypothetical protein
MGKDDSIYDWFKCSYQSSYWSHVQFWVAGPTIEYTHWNTPISEIIKKLTTNEIKYVLLHFFTDVNILMFCFYLTFSVKLVL